MTDDVDDGSTKPIGHQTDDGELEVREDGSERIYHETELGQHMRWMRQAPDLFEKYQALQTDQDRSDESLLRDVLRHLGNEFPRPEDRVNLELKIVDRLKR